MIFLRSKTPIVMTALLLTLSIVSGCASKGDTKDATDASVESAEASDDGGDKNPPEINEATGPSLLAAGKSVGNVVVSLNTDNMAADVAKVAQDYELSSKLDGALRGNGSFKDGGGLNVDVKVSNMRLRTNQAAIWAGIMAGPDWITADVNVTENGQVVKTYQVKSVTTLGGFGYGSRTKRMGRMVKDLGNKVVAGL